MAPELVAGGGYGALIREKPHCAVSDTGRSADRAREGHFYRGICNRYVRRSQSVVTHMGYCLQLECERSGVPLRKIQQNGQPIAGRVVVSRWLSALNFLILLVS